MNLAQTTLIDSLIIPAVVLVVGALVTGMVWVVSRWVLPAILEHRRVRKQNRFIDGLRLNKKLKEYENSATVEATHFTEIRKRRSEVGRTVQLLSYKIFGNGSPLSGFPQLPDVQFQNVDCKWCKQDIKPLPGPEGACPHCGLPFCFWVDPDKLDQS